MDTDKKTNLVLNFALGSYVEERAAALALEIHAAAEYLAELLGKQAALAALNPPEV